MSGSLKSKHLVHSRTTILPLIERKTLPILEKKQPFKKGQSIYIYIYYNYFTIWNIEILRRKISLLMLIFGSHGQNSEYRDCKLHMYIGIECPNGNPLNKTHSILNLD